MGRSLWERHALNSIKHELADSEPQLAALLATFTNLASGEEMPAREEVRASSLRATRRSLTGRRPARQHPLARLSRWAYGRLSLLCVLMWLLTAIALIAGAVAMSRGGGQTACTRSWPAPCARPAPSSSRSSPGSDTQPRSGQGEGPVGGVQAGP